jgi:RluA family pseudouridine synthase
MEGRSVVRFRVVPQEEGTMLFQLVARRLSDLSTHAAKDLVRAGAVYVGHLRVRIPTVRVVAGERITIHPRALEVAEAAPDLVRFVHRDPSFVIVDKPPGIPVASTREHARGTLAEALRRALEREGLVRPYVGVVHRLDQGASGLVLYTIRDIANKSLHRQFVEHSIRRSYRVLVHGDCPDTFECEAPLVERPGGRGVRVDRDGHPRAKPAHTRFTRLRPAAPIDGTSLLQVELVTGRTHQIRVHAAERGFPVVGDRRYGSPDDPAERLHLHAWRLEFTHPLDGTTVTAQTELPAWAR